jgi:hypothetical protein
MRHCYFKWTSVHRLFTHLVCGAASIGILTVSLAGQTQPKENQAKSTGPQPRVENRKETPTLAFNNAKDIPSILDGDAFSEESRLKEKLPGNEFIGEKRALHEGVLEQQFLDGFRDSKECNGITFYRDTSKANTTVQITVNFHDDPAGHEQEWIWMLAGGPQQAGKEKTLSGLGIQSTAKLTARDVCITMWENLEPNHFPKPGGTIQ